MAAPSTSPAEQRYGSEVEDDLRRLLDELSTAIEHTRESYEDRTELIRLLAAVERRLRDDVPDEDHHRLINALKVAEVRFESDHPRLGDALRQAAQTLSAAGI
jgi:ABC-type transporter Mla subunit MlaD